jgi:hypothetical protein
MGGYGGGGYGMGGYGGYGGGGYGMGYGGGVSVCLARPSSNCCRLILFILDTYIIVYIFSAFFSTEEVV